MRSLLFGSASVSPQCREAKGVSIAEMSPLGLCKPAAPEEKLETACDSGQAKEVERSLTSERT